MTLHDLISPYLVQGYLVCGDTCVPNVELGCIIRNMGAPEVGMNIRTAAQRNHWI